MDLLTKRRSGKELERPKDVRDAFERDRARIIHSAAFRRLQAKTQVLGISEGDFHRTRLTHSMEVAQISRGIVLTLKEEYPDKAEIMPGCELLEAICLAHDLGHPPFGHGGEIALNFMMRDCGGFEGNGQTLRIIGKLESHTPSHGLDLTRRTLLGVLKYPVNYETVCKTSLPKIPERFSQVKRNEWKPPKCYMSSENDLVDWVLSPFCDDDRKKFIEFEKKAPDEHSKSKYKALDTSIMELADDIAYGVHDLEDGIALKLITRDHWAEVKNSINSDWADRMGLSKMEDDLFDTSNVAAHKRKQSIGGIVHAFIKSTELRHVDGFAEDLLKNNARIEETAKTFLTALKDLTYKYIIASHGVQSLEYRGQFIVMSLFDTISSDPLRLLPITFSHLCHTVDEKAKRRIVCDYIAGMTDEYATRIYERLFVPRHGTVFERL